MKTLITLVFAVLFLTACNGQSSAIEDQKKIYKALDEMVARGMVPTTEGGYTMTATIDGKPWKAQAMYPVYMNGSIHACYAESTIDLPYDDHHKYKPGEKDNFTNDGHGPIFAPPGPFDLYTVHTGQMEITKVSGDWLEGTFYFTAVLQDNPSKKIEVTNGFFRVSTKKR
jgi:hypothetical protein